MQNGQFASFFLVAKIEKRTECNHQEKKYEKWESKNKIIETPADFNSIFVFFNEKKKKNLNWFIPLSK